MGLLLLALAFSAACGDDEAGPFDPPGMNPVTPPPAGGDGGTTTPPPAPGNVDSGTTTPPTGSADTGTVVTPPPGKDAGTPAPVAQDGSIPVVTDGAAPVTPPGTGTCCPDGQCICRGEEPTASTSKPGQYKTAKYTLKAVGYGGATVYHPTDAEPPYSGAVFCPPLTGVQAMYADWGPFLASHGIVLVTMDSNSTQDSVQSRGTQLAAAVKQLRGENERADSPLKGKLANRIGTMGWSMGGGATWIAAAKDPTLKSSVSMAGHNATGGGAANSKGTTVPSMQLAGETDTGILGGMGQSQGVYTIIEETTPKVLFVIKGVGHMTWGGPTDATAAGGEWTLAFQKTFLDGDVRWKKFLTAKPTSATEFKTSVK